MLVEACEVLAVQANVTDNTPIHVLGGNILPISRGGMTTAAARSAPLSLLVALGKAPQGSGGSTPERCSGPCTAQEVPSSCLFHPMHGSGMRASWKNCTHVLAAAWSALHAMRHAVCSSPEQYLCVCSRLMPSLSAPTWMHLANGVL
jgi:hypothetical protein